MAISASKSTTLSANTGAPYSNATLTAKFVENSTSTSGNTSNITVTATQTIGNADWNSSYTSSLKIYWWDDKNGERLVATTNVTSQGRNATITASGTITAAHHTDGTLKGYAKAVWTKGGSSNWTPNSGSVSTNNTSLTNIPRYPTSNQSLNNKTETTITMNYSSDSTCDYLWYSTNNGSTWTGINITDGKSGSYTISGLTAGTTYNIKTRLRRKDSQLTKDSSALAVATYSYPYANSMPNFTIGNQFTIGIYNPLGRSVTVNILGADNSQCTNDTTSGTSITGYAGAAVVTNFYNSIPNAKSGTYKVKVTYGSQVSTKTGGTYTVNAADCSPSISAVTYADVNSTVTAITGNNQNIVQNQSTVQYTATGLAAQKGASISSVKVVVNGNTYTLTRSGSTATGGNAAIDSSMDVTATATITDSRGLTAFKSVTVNMLAWSLPTAIITMQRQNNFYSETDITVDADYPSVDSKNWVKIWVRYKQTTSNTWGSWVEFQDNVMQTLTLDNNYEWDVKVSIDDAFGGNTQYNLTLSRGMPIIFFDRILSSVGFNCFPVDEKSVEVNGFNIERCIMTRGLSAQITNLTVNTYTIIPLNLSNSTGSRLTASSNGGIQVGAGVSKVLVSGKMAVEGVTTAGNRHLRIVKNTYTAANTLGWAWDTLAVSDSEDIIIPPQLVNVTEGDIINLYYYTGNSADKIGGNAQGGRTSLTVEVVA